MKFLFYIWGILLGLFFMLWTFFVAVAFSVLVYLIPLRKFHDWYVQNVWSGVLLWVSAVDVHVSGLQHLKDSGGLFVFNHSSNFDIPLMFKYLPSLRFGAKSELFRLPFLSRSMKAIGILPIHRNNRKKVMGVYKEASTRMKNGEFFALAPEGKRVSVSSICEFKNGPFVFAANAKGDIYPVVIYGARDVMTARSIIVNPGRWGGNVWIQVLAPISTKDVDPSDVSKIRDHAREEMIKVYDQLKAASHRDDIYVESELAE